MKFINIVLTIIVTNVLFFSNRFIYLLKRSYCYINSLSWTIKIFILLHGVILCVLFLYLGLDLSYSPHIQSIGSVYGRYIILFTNNILNLKKSIIGYLYYIIHEKI